LSAIVPDESDIHGWRSDADNLREKIAEIGRERLAEGPEELQ
jgi:hypothetical protein